MTTLALAVAGIQIVMSIACVIACIRIRAGRLPALCQRWHAEDPNGFDDFCDRWRDFTAQCHVHGWFKG